MQDRQVNVHTRYFDPTVKIRVAGDKVRIFSPLGSFLSGRVRGGLGLLYNRCSRFYRLNGFHLFFLLIGREPEDQPADQPCKGRAGDNPAKSALVRCFINSNPQNKRFRYCHLPAFPDKQQQNHWCPAVNLPASSRKGSHLAARLSHQAS